MRRRVRIAGTGTYLPKRIVTASDLDRKLGKPEGYSEKLSGVKTRYYAEDETSSQMGAKAATAALEDAGLRFADVDGVIGACGTPEQGIPSTAALIQRALGQEDSGVPCFDINSTCLSFVTAFDTLSYLIDAGRFRRVLIVSTEVASVGLNWNQHEACSLFGDGAAAVVLERTPENGTSRVIGSHMETFSSGADYCRILGGGTKLHPRDHYSAATVDDYLFHMDGRKVFRLAAEVLPAFMQKLLARAELRLDEIRLVVPHQASLAGLELMRRKLGIAEERWMRTVEDYGNMIAASIPFTLHLAILDDRLRRGDKALLLGTSAGFSVGGLVFEY